MRRVLTALLLLAGLAVLPATPAYAAGLTPVTGFGSNPGALAMYAYRPDGLAAGAPLVVALHGCTQSAQDYHDHAGWAKFADAYGFTVVYPQQSTANNATSCFNWYQTGDTTRGQGEVLSVKQMIDYAVATYGSDPSRVYVTGLSAGGAMASALLATYPDVFAGGAVVAGLPYRCATDLTSAYTCMYAATSKTPAQWGDLVRAADPGYGGARPRVAIWYGTPTTPSTRSTPPSPATSGPTSSGCRRPRPAPRRCRAAPPPSTTATSWRSTAYPASATAPRSTRAAAPPSAAPPAPTTPPRSAPPTTSRRSGAWAAEPDRAKPLRGACRASRV